MTMRFNTEATFKVPEFISSWTNKEKAEFAFQLLRTMPTDETIHVIERLSTHLRYDIISQLPYEIALHIFGLLDRRSLVQASLVSRNWKTICDEQVLWRGLFEGHGWKIDQDEISHFLNNKPQEDDRPTRHTPVPIKRNSQAIKPRERLMELTSKRSSRRLASKYPKSEESPLYHSRDSHEANISYHDHYDPLSDSRFINWKTLYKNRFELQKRWLSGSCKVESFPPASTDSDHLHSEGIYCIQFDKRKLITGSRDRSIKLWDLETGRCTLQLNGHQGSVLCLQYDDQQVISGSSDSNIIIFDIKTGALIRVLRGHQDSVLGLRVVKEELVLSCSKDRTLRLWKRETGKLIRTFHGHCAAVNAVQWKGDRIVSASGDRTVKIWDLDSGECLKTLTGHARGVACVEFDGKHIVTGSSDQTIKVWDAVTGDCIYTLFGHTALVRTIQFDSAASLIISGCYNGQLKIWSLTEGRLVRDLGQATDGRILNLKFDCARIMCCSNSTHVITYNFAHGIDTQFLL